MILNVGGAALSIAVIIIYSNTIAHIELWSCNDWDNSYPDERKCLEAVRLTEV